MRPTQGGRKEVSEPAAPTGVPPQHLRHHRETVMEGLAVVLSEEVVGRGGRGRAFRAAASVTRRPPPTAVCATSSRRACRAIGIGAGPLPCLASRLSCLVGLSWGRPPGLENPAWRSGATRPNPSVTPQHLSAFIPLLSPIALPPHIPLSLPIFLSLPASLSPPHPPALPLFCDLAPPFPSFPSASLLTLCCV